MCRHPLLLHSSNSYLQLLALHYLRCLSRPPLALPWRPPSSSHPLPPCTAQAAAIAPKQLLKTHLTLNPKGHFQQPSARVAEAFHNPSPLHPSTPPPLPCTKAPEKPIPDSLRWSRFPLYPAVTNKEDAMSIRARKKQDTVSFEDLQQHFDLPLEAVAEKFDMCCALLKKVCRRLGIKRWPYRQVSCFTAWSVYTTSSKCILVTGILHSKSNQEIGSASPVLP